MIIISADYFGQELKGSKMWNAISAVRKVISDLRCPEYQGTLGVIPHVNVVFMVAGSLGKPDFDNVRVGPYSSKDKCVQIDVAVPTVAVESLDSGSVVVLGLHMANASAFHFFDEIGLSFPLREAEALVQAAADKLGIVDPVPKKAP